MTLKELLNKRDWKKEYWCWDYEFALYSESDERLWMGDEGLEDEDALENLLVISYEPEWYLGDDHESYKRCRIVVKTRKDN